MALLAAGLVSAAPAAEDSRPNVLFISVDDLRPELGCYGRKLVKSPNIDGLAAQGRLFTRAYCQQAICGPSRASLMTGLRPDSAGVVHNKTYFRDTVPHVVTLPQHFRRHGYETVYIGKIYHGWMRDEEKSWSAKASFAKYDPPVSRGQYQLAESQQIVRRRRIEVKEKYGELDVEGLTCGPATECADVPDHAYADGRSADAAVLTLRRLKDRPFFLAVGFYKPHLPFVAPKRYWDMYDPAEIPLTQNPLAPKGAPAVSLHSSFELRTRVGIPKRGPIDDPLARRLIHGYLACASYVDAQIGKILAELEGLGLRKNTIVILWGDHGWHLGDHGIWGKATNYEVATRVPLVVRVPGQPARGQSCDALVELVDMYPTLCDLAGLPLPDHLEGTSFAPLLANPKQPWKTAALSQFPCPALREWAALPLSDAMRQTFFGPLIAEAERRIAAEHPDDWSPERFNERVMGYTIRTERHRLVRWVDVRDPDRELAVELYDHQTDPHETRNIAGDPANADIVEQLTAQLKAGWQASQPLAASHATTSHGTSTSLALNDVNALANGCLASGCLGNGCLGSREASPQQADNEAAPRRDFGLIKTDVSPLARLRSVDLGGVRWTDGFWADRFRQCREVTLPRLWELAEPWAWHNMQVAAGLQEGEAKGCYWEDAWIYKWIESACYLYSQSRDPKLLEQLDEIIAVVAKAQAPDGYLATQITLRGVDRFSNYRYHEVYTMGHLLTAACAHHRITGKTSLLDVARRAGDFLHKEYTTSENPYLVNCPVNPSVIMGAVELYRTTGEKRYLELANIIIDNRGKKRPPVPRAPWGGAMGNTDLNQDRVPLRKAKEVVGHAVFWSYLYAGAADAFLETGDQTLIDALERLWLDLTRKKMYVTGGVSPVHKGLSNRSYEPGRRVILNDEVHEAAGLPFDLPNATAYNETCGQIGNLMWNGRMLAARPEARFADVMELSLYNAILSGVGIEGKGWTYTNPLRWHGPEHELLSADHHQRFDPGERHICCPTNLMRTVASWHGWLYANDAEGLWVHHYGANEATIELPRPFGGGSQISHGWDGRLRLTMEADFPWDGRVRLHFDEVTASGPFALRMRVPGWANGAELFVNDERVADDVPSASYVSERRVWKPGDVVELSLPMPVRLLAADPRVEQVRDHVAVMRGPIVYCLESIDLPRDVAIEQIRLPRNAEWTVRYEPSLLRGVVVLQTEAFAVPKVDAAGPLYQELPPGEPRRVPIRLIPYFAWNNRGEPKMTVWIPLL
jgi:iduronate 2-sulfatase